MSEWGRYSSSEKCKCSRGTCRFEGVEDKIGVLQCWMKAGRQVPQGQEKRPRVIDMWEVFNAEQLMTKVGWNLSMYKEKVEAGNYDTVTTYS